jgi:hypothetical protein
MAAAGLLFLDLVHQLFVSDMPLRITSGRPSPGGTPQHHHVVQPRQSQHGPGYESRNRRHGLQRAHRGPCIAGYELAAGKHRMTA